jgi:hypothetical protein
VVYSCAVNKVMCLVLLLGAVGSFLMSQKESFSTQSVTRYGNAVGEERTVSTTSFERAGFLVFGACCMVGGLYLMVQIRPKAG